MLARELKWNLSRKAMLGTKNLAFLERLSAFESGSSCFFFILMVAVDVAFQSSFEEKFNCTLLLIWGK